MPIWLRKYTYNEILKIHTAQNSPPENDSNTQTLISSTGEINKKAASQFKKTSYS